YTLAYQTRLSSSTNWCDPVKTFTVTLSECLLANLVSPEAKPSECQQARL
ncbi:hypothetical protein BaRGS_00024662, partial [Batillaria attramentaria]